MTDPYLPAGVTDNDPHFRDDTEPDDDYFDEPCVHGSEVYECRVCNDDVTDSRTDAELRGEPYPRNAVEAAEAPPRELVEREMRQ